MKKVDKTPHSDFFNTESEQTRACKRYRFLEKHARLPTFALKNKKAAMHIYNSVNKEMFELYINRVSQRTIDGYMELAAKKYNITDRDREVITMYYKSLIIGFMFNWLNNGMNNNLTDDLKRICELFEGNTELVLGRCDKKEE